MSKSKKVQNKSAADMIRKDGTGMVQERDFYGLRLENGQFAPFMGVADDGSVSVNTDAILAYMKTVKDSLDSAAGMFELFKPTLKKSDESVIPAYNKLIAHMRRLNDDVAAATQLCDQAFVMFYTLIDYLNHSLDKLDKLETMTDASLVVDGDGSTRFEASERRETDE